MRNKYLIFIITFVIILTWSYQGFALKENTHIAINEHVAQNTVNEFSLDSYLINNLDFNSGSKEVLLGVDAEGKNRDKPVFWWLGYGGEQEDRPGDWYDYLPLMGQPTRSVNHFHNPLKGWNEAGLNDSVLGITYSGQSQVLWAQNPGQNVGGNWSWQDARGYFYSALAGREL
jgi:hypothetical protein